MADLEMQLFEVKHDAERARIKLNEQEALVKNLTEQARENKQKSRECIVKLFSELKELLNKKRTELLVKEYDAYLPVETTLSTCTHSVHIGLRAVTELLDDAEVEAGRRVPIERLRLMTTVINDEIIKCERLVEDVQIPEVFVANSTVKDIIGGLQYGETESVEGADQLEDSSDRDGNRNTSENEARDNTDIVNDDIPPESDTVVASDDGISHETESSDVPDNIPTPSEAADENYVVPSAPSYGAVEGAEAVPLYVALDDIDPEEPPPPYWQAVGLAPPGTVDEMSSDSRVQTVDESRGAPSSRMVEETSGNRRDEDEVWELSDDGSMLHEVKCFKGWQVNEKNPPKMISLSWKYNRLCFADKSNQSLKFYEATGEQIVKMSFSGEIGDAAFLNAESDDDSDVNYFVTFPNDHIIMIASIDSHGIPNVVKRIRVKEKYTAICKGPRDYTFIAAVTEPRAGSPRVDMCNFSGNIILSLAYTREGTWFGYPSSVAVFKHCAIIADWKLNLVCIYNVRSGSSLRSQYNGALENQLLHPCDLEVDQHGNILILEGERRKIHMINLDSELTAVLEIPAFGSALSVPRALALETIPEMQGYEGLSPRVAVVSHNGYLCVFDFRGGYRYLRESQRSRAVRSISCTSNTGSEGYALRSGTEGMLPSTVATFGAQSTGRGTEGMLPSTVFGLPSQRNSWQEERTRTPRQGYGSSMVDRDSLRESAL